MSVPVKDSLLVPYGENFNTRINGDPSRWGFTLEEAADYQTALEGYVQAYDTLMQARANGTRSESQTAAKDAAKTTFLAIAREYYGLVQASTSISDADKILVGVHVRDVTPSPIPAPTVRPGVEITSVDGRTINARIYDIDTETKRAKAPGTIAAIVYSFVGEDYPSDPTAWSYEGSTSNGKHQIVVPDSVAGGSRVWICAAWMNPRQQTGPVAVPVAATVQSGGVNASQLKMAA